MQGYFSCVLDSYQVGAFESIGLSAISFAVNVVTMGNLEFMLFNCSMSKEHLLKNVSEEKPIVTSKTSEIPSINPFVVILCTILINTVLHYIFCKRATVKHFDFFIKRLFNKETVSRIIVLLILLLILPVIIVILVLALCYKVLCTVVIWRKDKHYVGLLDSFDVFWSLENEATINVLGVIESESPELLVESIKNKLQSVVAKTGVDKIFYRRNEEYGFYYWRKYCTIDVSQYVEVLDFPEKTELNVMDLEDIMSEVSYQTLPYDNEGLFKIFVTKQRVCNHCEDKNSYGIIFIIHHSVGDGVALLEFLCKTFADDGERSPVSMFSVPETKNFDTPTAIFGMIKNLWEMPLCLVNTILRTPDVNDLHGPSLFQDKLYKWTDSDENLLAMVKEIKENVANVTFSDVLATALSGGMHDFFTKTMGHVPEELGVILPVRFPKSSSIIDDHQHQLLSNDFSVTILELPVNEKRNLTDIKRRCDALRVSVDPLSNHYFIKLVSLFPKQLLQPILKSSQATLVFSNMPGPAKLSICGGNTLELLVFFVPHKGNTGLDVTALSYGGVLRFAASADKALISDREHLAYILDGMVEEVKRLHREYVAK